MSSSSTWLSDKRLTCVNSTVYSTISEPMLSPSIWMIDDDTFSMRPMSSCSAATSEARRACSTAGQKLPDSRRTYDEARTGRGSSRLRDRDREVVSDTVCVLLAASALQDTEPESVLVIDSACDADSGRGFENVPHDTDHVNVTVCVSVSVSDTENDREGESDSSSSVAEAETVRDPLSSCDTLRRESEPVAVPDMDAVAVRDGRERDDDADTVPSSVAEWERRATVMVGDELALPDGATVGVALALGPDRVTEGVAVCDTLAVLHLDLLIDSEGGDADTVNDSVLARVSVTAVIVADVEPLVVKDSVMVSSFVCLLNVGDSVWVCEKESNVTVRDLLVSSESDFVSDKLVLGLTESLVGVVAEDVAVGE